MSTRDLRIAIIGAGPGGLCMGKRLLDEGYDDFVILEQADDVGGTWYANHYPGCTCDTPAVMYSFSFEINPKWSNFYVSQPEILEYLRNIADKYELRSHCRFGNAVAGAKWNETSSSWLLTLDSGDTVVADVVVSAMGMFNEPHWPDIKGLDKFKGSMWHSAKWKDNHDLANDRVAIIGGGSSSVEIVPEMVKIAAHVSKFQRSSNYVLPKHFKIDSKKKLKSLIANSKSYNELRTNLEQIINTFNYSSGQLYPTKFETEALAAIDIVRDPVVRNKLHPDYPFGLKRAFFSNSYYQAFNKANLELVTEQITLINEHSIITADGTERDIDTIIICTGFEDPKFLSSMDVVGRKGQTISEAWDNGIMAYLGILTTGFPNLFMLFGPNTYTGSVPVMIETQVEYILAHILQLASGDIASIDVRHDAMIKYDNDVQAVFNGTPEKSVDYENSARLGKKVNIKLWPSTIDRYKWLTSKIDPDAFTTTKIKKKAK